MKKGESGKEERRFKRMLRDEPRDKFCLVEFFERIWYENEKPT